MGEAIPRAKKRRTKRFSRQGGRLIFRHQEGEPIVVDRIRETDGRPLAEPKAQQRGQTQMYRATGKGVKKTMGPIAGVVALDEKVTGGRQP